MKRMTFILFITLMALFGCHSNHFYDDLPRPIAQFLSQYWADPDIENYTQPTPQKYVVIIKNGPSLVFNENYEWTDIDGNGLPLPQILLFDQLPEKLYDYIESGSQLNQVFSIRHDARYYYIKLLNTHLTYDIHVQSVREFQ